MTKKLWLAYLWVLAALASCAGAVTRHEPGSAAEAAAADVAVVRQGDVWTAEFRFNQDSPAWVFTRSALARVGERPWRPQSWTVETPGVRLERRGRYDVLVAQDGGMVPRNVRIRFTPFAQGLLADYDPALLLTDGTVALFTEQFNLFPMTSVAAVEALPVDLNGTGFASPRTRIRFRDQRGTMLYRGRRVATAEASGQPGYVIFGRTEPVVTPAMASVTDPQLPQWLRAALSELTPAILADYARRLGPAPGGPPTFIVSWAGPTAGLRSMGGSVLPSTVIMRFEGEGVVQETAGVRNAARAFIAHEAAHFWLGEAVRYEFSRDAWIIEGGADLLAIRTVAGLDPRYDARAELQKSLDDCVRFASAGSIETAQERNEHRAYYTCGAMFGLIAEAAARRSAGGDFFTFVRGIVEANRADGVVTKDEWLLDLTRISGDPSLARDIRTMVETRVADPSAALASLFERAGIGHSRDAQGKLRLS